MLLNNLKMTQALQLFVATMNSSNNITAEYVFVLTLNTYLVLILAKQVRILDLAIPPYKHKLNKIKYLYDEVKVRKLAIKQDIGLKKACQSTPIYNYDKY